MLCSSTQVCNAKKTLDLSTPLEMPCFAVIKCKGVALAGGLSRGFEK